MVLSRKSISVNESKMTKSCNLIEKMLKELNTKSKKISLLKADDEMGDADMSKIALLDELADSLDNAISIISKL